MKISLVQPDTVWENKAANLSILSKMITPLFNNTDLVVLPEMFNTGFSMNTEALGEKADGETFSWMKKISEQGNFGLCGSYIVSEENRNYNRFVFVSPGNEVWHYNKRHLFSMAHEQDFFTPGKERLIFTFRGVRICPLVCYDLRFPVWSRNRNEYDLLIYSANWPESRKKAWNSLIRARAIENQCFVAAVNRTGTDPKGIMYWGESAVISYYGETLLSAGAATEGVETVEISLDELAGFRRKFPFLDDADDFIIQ